MPADTDVSIRPTRRTDADAIAALHARNGLEQVSATGWAEQWESYPFADQFADVPWGWVIETADGEVVGSIGNVHMCYQLGEQPLRAAIATNWAVDPAFRFKSLHLTTAFFKQKNLDLLVNGSANPSASKVLSGMGVPKIPIPTYVQPCFWAASPRRFVRAVLKRRGIPGADILAIPAGLALSVRRLLLVGAADRTERRLRVDEVDQFDERFDALWPRLSPGPVRLRAVRTRATLTWRFANAPATRRVICTVEDGGQLAGYLVMVRRPGTENGLSLFDVADVQAVNDDSAAYRALLRAAVSAAAARGADAIKLLTGTPAKRAPALTLRPFSYTVDNWPLYYRATPPWREALASADAWDFSLFDTY